MKRGVFPFLYEYNKFEKNLGTWDESLIGEKLLTLLPRKSISLVQYMNYHVVLDVNIRSLLIYN